MTQDLNQTDSGGRSHGVWEQYWSAGTLRWRYNYLHGVLHGLCEMYRSDGTLWWIQSWKHGNPQGLWSWYDTPGTSRNKRYHLTIK
jgi:antitoxin component YwqK of YwqJK toxin-antitoxin module